MLYRILFLLLFFTTTYAATFINLQEKKDHFINLYPHEEKKIIYYNLTPRSYHSVVYSDFVETKELSISCNPSNQKIAAGCYKEENRLIIVCKMGDAKSYQIKHVIYNPSEFSKSIGIFIK